MGTKIESILSQLVGGWPTPLKNDGRVRHLGLGMMKYDEIPNWMEGHKIPWFQTTNQPIVLNQA